MLNEICSITKKRCFIIIINRITINDIGDGDNTEGAETVSAEENGDESDDENDIEALISIDFSLCIPSCFLI